MAKKKKKNNLIDFPSFDPTEKVTFPPIGPATDERENDKKRQHTQLPYDDTYIADVPTPDPSQTMPGAPDIRDPNARIDPEMLRTLSPNPDWKDGPKRW